MNPVFRSVIVFAILFVVLRISGRRTMADITTFDFILLLIIGDLTQQAIVGNDYSIITMALCVVTLVVLDLGMGRLALTSKKMERLLESVPVVVVDNGKPLSEVMNREGVDEEEILAAARQCHGLQRMEDIRYAIVERHGGITIVPQEQGS